MVTFPEYRVTLHANEPRGVPNVDAKRTKLGGKPDWIQADETPFCPTCNRGMVLVAQIDSVDDYFMFGDAGMLYVFQCTGCGSPAALVQSY